MDDANGKNKKDLVDLIEAVRDALDGGDKSALRKATEQLTDLIFVSAPSSDPETLCRYFTPAYRRRNQGKYYITTG